MAAIISWPGHTPTVAPSSLVAAIDRIQAESERPRLSIVTGKEPEAERDPRKWRRAYFAFRNDMRRDTCDYCKGTGEIIVSYEGDIDPCPKCQWANPYLNSSNERAF